MRSIGIAFLVALSLASIAAAAEAPPLLFADLGDLELESGGKILGARLGYRTAGKLDDKKSNAILFPTWFTGTSEALFASGSLDSVDTSRFFLITVDALGNGVSSSPSTSERQPGESFPRVTIGDMVRAEHRLVTDVLGIEHLHAVMGISMGGMQTFEWITAYPDFMSRAVPIVGSPRLGTYDLLLWQTEVEVIDLARTSGNVEAAAPVVGMIAQLALRTPEFHSRSTPRESFAKLVEETKAGSTMRMYDQRAQLQAMIAHDVSRKFGGSMAKAAKAVRAEVLNVVAISDHMVTPGPALEFADLLGTGSMVLSSDCAHLAPSCEADRVRKAVQAFLER